MDKADTRYARSAAGWIAHQVIGSGSVDVLVHKLWWTPLDLLCDEPRHERFREGMSRFSRHIWFDSLGTGSSDPIGQPDDRLIESIVDEMVAVIDHLGIEKVVVLGLAPAALLFAATHPERIKALVLVNPYARAGQTDGYPHGMPNEDLVGLLTFARKQWGSGWYVRTGAPSLDSDKTFARWAGRAERLSASREDFAWRLHSAFTLDLRHVLGAIRVPTLVVNRADYANVAMCRYVADHIPNAKTIEVPGSDLLCCVGDIDPILDAIEEFVTGSVAARDDDRVLATVMFTDVVASTERLVEQGDRRWQERLATHNEVVRGEIERFRGRAVNTTGDGFVATFDGPGRAVRCAASIRDALHRLQIDVRIGLHTGEIELRGDDIGGIAVHLAQRVQALAAPAEVLVSSTVKDLVAGSGIMFSDRGRHALKGLPGEWQLFSTHM